MKLFHVCSICRPYKDLDEPNRPADEVEDFGDGIEIEKEHEEGKEE